MKMRETMKSYFFGCVSLMRADTFSELVAGNTNRGSKV